ncbi:hypothetical protein DE146DRAFT_749983 [Phaeosphaeria sp. MPI-PUGE-AT-0046c]|nr:hypothetical protein DE146DRAFT_749983 [Phaeosphaeria sp. MPI-PUGE-AT-0046c]
MRSTHPCPSSPGFLYPEPIVPPAVTALQPVDSQSSLNDNNFIWYRPYGLRVYIFTVIILGLAWAGLAFLVAFPPQTWSLRCKRENKVERRSLNKPSKYTPDSEDMGISDSTSNLIPTLCLYNDTIGGKNGGMEMKYRVHHHSPRKASTPTTQTKPIHAIPLSSARSTTTSTHPFPVNPFLFPPAQVRANRNPRTSSEYLAQHTSFFSPNPLSPYRTTSTSPHPSSSSLSAPYTAAYDLNTSEIEALEAGTACPTPRMILESHERKKSWVDFGIAKVEHTVNGLVERLVRWTDDGDDGVLLPVANGRREVQVR